MEPVATMDLEPAAVSVPLARKFAVCLAGLLVGVPESEREQFLAAVALATSELVANAVAHARGRVTVCVRPEEGFLRLEVTDDGPGEPRTMGVDVSSLTGRGLAIVDRLATQWGWCPTPDGKVVWLRLDPARLRTSRRARSASTN